MKKAVIIPSYKAEKTLPSVLERLPGAYWEDGIAIIINDGSPDRTGEVAEGLKAKWPKLIVEHHNPNQGYGAGVKTGFRRALAEGCEVFAIVHADGQYAPEKVLELIAPVERGEALLVQGSRMIGGGAREGGMPLVRYIPNKILTAIENIAFGTDYAEFHSGYMVYSAELVRQVPFELLQNNYNIDAEMMICAKILGYRAVEVPIPTRYDDETSSLDPIPYGINVLKMVARHLCGHYRKILREHHAAVQKGDGRSCCAQ